MGFPLWQRLFLSREGRPGLQPVRMPWELSITQVFFHTEGSDHLKETEQNLNMVVKLKMNLRGTGGYSSGHFTVTKSVEHTAILSCNLWDEYCNSLNVTTYLLFI